MSNHLHKIEEKSTKISWSSSKAVSLGLVDLWELKFHTNFPGANELRLSHWQFSMLPLVTLFLASNFQPLEFIMGIVTLAITTRTTILVPYLKSILTHWGREMHISVSKLTIIGSDNGLSPGWHQAIIWTNAGILLVWTLGTNFSEILSEIHVFSFKKMHLKMSFAKWCPFCLGLNVLKV